MRDKKTNSKKLSKKEMVSMLLANKELELQDEKELMDLLFNEPISIDIDKQEDAKRSFGDKFADSISKVAGSWTFIVSFLCFLIIWMSINVFYLSNSPFDPYPFILLNLMLSCVAALQAPIIMMSQNRQSKKDSIKNHNDYKIDLKSELILETLHEEMDIIIKNQKEILKLLKEKKAKEI